MWVKDKEAAAGWWKRSLCVVCLQACPELAYTIHRSANWLFFWFSQNKIKRKLKLPAEKLKKKKKKKSKKKNRCSHCKCFTPWSHPVTRPAEYLEWAHGRIWRNAHSPPCVWRCAGFHLYMHEYRHTHIHTHTHIATQVKQYSHKQRGEPESRRQSSPRGAPSSYLHPSSSSSLLGWGWGCYTGVTCLLLKVSKHPGESLFTPLKKVGIPISWRPSSPSATHGCRGDEKRNQRGCDGNKLQLFFCRAQLLVPLSFQYFYALISRLSSLLLLPLLFSLTLALPPRQTSMLWYPPFSVSAVMTHVPIHPPLSTLLEVYSKSSSNRHGLLPFIEHFLLNKPSRHSTSRIFGLFKRIPSWRSPMQSRRRV